MRVDTLCELSVNEVFSYSICFRRKKDLLITTGLKPWHVGIIGVSPVIPVSIRIRHIVIIPGHTFSEIAQVIGKCQHKILLQYFVANILDIRLCNISVNASVLFQQVKHT